MRWLRFYTCWTFILGWTALFPLGNCDILIIRKVNKKDTYHKDRFNIHRSKCTDIRQGNKCGIYGGFERSPNNPCKCHCPPRRGTITLQNKQWRCRSNEALRQLQGCGFSFLYESSDSYVEMVIPKKWYYFNAPTSECALSKTSYLSCNGSWVKIPNMAKHIDVIILGFDPVARSYTYKMRIKNKLRLLAGKLIKLYLNCTSFGGNPCLLFKMKGKQNCFTRRAKKIKKNNIHVAQMVSPSSPSKKNKIPRRHSINSTLLSARKASERSNRTRSRNREGNWRTQVNDRRITTLILTSTAVFLGLVVVGLAINLCFCSTNQESHKGKHIFRRDPKGASRMRSSTASSTTSHTLSLSVEISSKTSGGVSSSLCKTQDGGLFFGGERVSLSRYEGVS